MLGVSVHEARGVVADLLEKLGGPNGAEWLTASKRFLRKENPWDGKPVTFLVWRTITLGAFFKDVNSIKKALEKNGFQVSDWAADLMSQAAFRLATESIDVDLVRLTVAELGFPEGATLQEIYARGKELGLNLCPAEVGPALRYQYPDQPKGEWLTIAMEPIAGSDGRPLVLYVDHGRDARWLDAHWSSPGSFWRSENQFVFVSK
ncbi:MAG: hypothetical protein HYS88_00430 [Candidatus Colwellbacteria bacterium]|nr:hypothetical protein [Candidatus Colwellbacteria bacterium]